MTDSTKGTGAANGPPWSVDVLADLHAGVLDAKQSSELWQQVNTDPQARAVLDALDGVKNDLDRLGDAPVEPMPAQYATKLDAALQAEARSTSQSRPAQPGVAPVVDLAEARRKRGRRMAWGVGVLTAAAAAIAVAFVAFPQEETGGSPVAGDNNNGETSQEAPGAQPPLALSGDDLSSAISGLSGKQDYGSLEDEQGLSDCLEKHDIDMDSLQVVGIRPVTLDGAEGVAALLIPGEQDHRFRLVIVDPACSADELITDTSLG